MKLAFKIIISLMLLGGIIGIIGMCFENIKIFEIGDVIYVLAVVIILSTLLILFWTH